ncbi:hypothetical protein [Paenibacillus taichungensis]
MNLNDRIYCLQRTMNMSDDLRQKVHQADVLYLQDQESAAEHIINEVEVECNIRGISIYRP